MSISSQIVDNLQNNQRYHSPTAAEALKKWDGGRVTRGRVWASPVWDLGCHPRKIYENILYRCKFVQFGDFGVKISILKKWDGGRVPRGRVWASPVWDLGCHPRKIYENILYRCKFVQFGDFGVKIRILKRIIQTSGHHF